MIDREAILAANAAFYDALAAGDAAAMDGLWGRSAPVVCIHPGWPAIFGREQVMDSWRAILSNPPKVVADAPRLFGYGDTAMVVCREIIAGNVLVASNLFVREADGWKLVHHQSGPTPERVEETPPPGRMH